jgi:hypothetical protein
MSAPYVCWSEPMSTFPRKDQFRQKRPSTITSACWPFDAVPPAAVVGG